MSAVTPASEFSDSAAGPAQQASPPGVPVTLAAGIEFALPVFLGAFLLFQVQPLIGKYLLPWFGGTPAVWTTCMLFFQALLFAGYLYAHASVRWFVPRSQALLHVLLLLAAFVSLPLAPDPAWKPEPGSNPTAHILALLGVSLGLPYFVLSATGPLLQHWFSRLHPGVSPYRLYALSNFGSLLALVSYPFLFEPNLPRAAQSAWWERGLAGFALLCAWCAFRLWRGSKMFGAPSVNTNTPAMVDSFEPSLGTRVFWFVLPACASILLLATTNKICQDVAVIPFLWVLPLALYLLTFVVCFDHSRWYARTWFLPLLCLACLGAGYALKQGVDLPLTSQVGIYSFALWACSMVCHGELYRLRPNPAQLTGYYLMIAAGGAMGGVLVGVIAPLCFHNYYEVPIGWWLCGLLVCLLLWRERSSAARFVPSWLIAATALATFTAFLAFQMRESRKDVVNAARNFYGVLRVFEYNPKDPNSHVFMLLSGEITHGFQFVNPDLRRKPVSYYHERSGIGLAWQALPENGSRKMGVVGLGTGTLAAYGRTNDTVRFYEINALSRQFAERHFTYLADAQARIEFALGDARLSLEREESQRFDLLALDAFSGDAVPAHLLTREAFSIYLRHLRPSGVLAVHITNRHLDLLPVIVNLATHHQLHWAFIPFTKNGEEWWNYSADWVLLSRSRELLEQPEIQQARRECASRLDRIGLWTDDYASLWRTLKQDGVGER